MDYEYNIECPIGDTESIVRTRHDDDIPRHCPMCGADVDAELLSDEE